MTASSRPSANRAGAALVVVCCAADDAESLRDALTALRGDGLEVELVEGLDQDPKQLIDVIDRRESEGLYVLCRSPRLGRELVEELREILLSRHIPFARTLTVAVGGRGALADRIRSGLRRASTRITGPNRSVGGVAPELVSTGRSRPLRTTNATEDEEPTLVGKRDLEGIASRPSVARPPASGRARPLISPPPPMAPPMAKTIAKTVAPATAPAAPPPTEVSVVEMIDEDLLADDLGALLDDAGPVADLDLSDLDQTGARRPSGVDNTSVGLSPALITGNTVIGPAPAMITGDTLQGEKLPPKLRELAERWPPPPSTTPAASAQSGPIELEPATTPIPRLSQPAPSASPSTPAPLASPSAPAPSFSPGAPPSPAVPTAIPATPSTSHSLPIVAGRTKALPWALGGVAVLLLALVIGLAVSGDDDPEGASSEAAADDAAPAPSTPSPDAKDEAKADSDEPEPSGPRTYRVVDALKSRKVRALDVLLIATDRGKPGDYPSAEAYCGGLEIEGLAGWRLPHVGELSSLADANMIGRGMYWSSTASDTFGDGHMAWNVRRSHAQPHDDDAIAVCVRGGARGS